MKKLLLGLGTLSLAALPFMAVVSCGGTTEKPAVVDIKIMPKATPTPLTIEETTPENIKKLTTLNKLFEGAGLIETNLSNLEISLIEIVAGNKLIVKMVAKNGFTINGTNSIQSKETPNPKPTATNLNITANHSTQPVLEAAITAITAIGATDDAKILALQTVFTGVTTSNFTNFAIETTPTTGTGPAEQVGTIVLTAKPGFIFGTSSTLHSVMDLEIVKQAVLAQTTIDASVATLLNPDALESAKGQALQNVFAGVTGRNLKYFTALAIPQTGSGDTAILSKIILTANPNFSFSGNPTLSSAAPNLDIVITAIESTQEQIDASMAILTKPDVTPEEQLTELSKLFEGIDATTIQYFVISTTLNPTTITLTAKTGFTINNGLTSVTWEM